jgi:hypothetical protein
MGRAGEGPDGGPLRRRSRRRLRCAAPGSVLLYGQSVEKGLGVSMDVWLIGGGGPGLRRDAALQESSNSNRAREGKGVRGGVVMGR